MKRPFMVLVALAALAAAAYGLSVASDDDDVVAAATTTEIRPPSTAVVTSKNLVETTEIEGVLGFGSVTALPNQAGGVATWLPEPGAIVGFGDVLYNVNDLPVIYLPGELPSYRAMNTRTEGTDVFQLEQYLDSLGLMEVVNATVDGDYTSYTGAVVEDWYESYDVDALTTIGAGMVVFGTEPFRVSSVNAALGATVNGGSVLSVTGNTRHVSVELDTSLAGLLEVGDVVQVELPDDTTASATVDFVSQVSVTEGQGQQATTYIPVELRLDGVGSLFDESPVTVMVEQAIELDATVVPISALLALAEGGYAVEVVVDGTPILTAVRLSNFLENEVSIVGDVEPGDQVIVPS